MKKLITICLAMCLAVIAVHAVPNDFHKKKSADVGIETYVGHDNYCDVAVDNTILQKENVIESISSFYILNSGPESYSEKISNRFDLTNQKGLKYKSRSWLRKSEGRYRYDRK